MKVNVDLPFDEQDFLSAEAEASKGNAGPLRALCRKEVEAFEASIRLHPDYSDGLVRIEKLAVEGYLYQKLRKHIDAKAAPRNLPTERTNGTT